MLKLTWNNYSQKCDLDSPILMIIFIIITVVIIITIIVTIFIIYNHYFSIAPKNLCPEWIDPLLKHGPSGYLRLLGGLAQFAK